jgi:excisionase family DNA binding protein
MEQPSAERSLRPVTSIGAAASAARSTPEPLTAADVMTAAEVAELLHMPTSTVEHLARLGTVPSRKVGRRRLFLRPRIEALLLGECERS